VEGVANPTVTVSCHEMGNFFFPHKTWRKDFEEREMDGSDGTRQDTEDTTIVQIEEVDLDIRALSFVTKLSPVGVRNSHGHGYQVSLRWPSYEEYGSCGKKQESPVQVSIRYPTLHVCFQELLKRLQEKHVKSAEALTGKASAGVQAAAAVHTPSVLEAMMLFQEAKKHAQAVQDRAKASQDQVKATKKVGPPVAKEYPRMQRAGNHGIFAKRRVPRGRAAGGTGGGCRLLGNIVNQAVCQLPPTVSASTFALDGTALRTYTARPLVVASLPCIPSSQCMETLIRVDPSDMVVPR
jgi:hypothetical protein